MSIERNLNGSWTVYAIVSQYLERRTYYGYTKRQAVAMFRKEFGV